MTVLRTFPSITSDDFPPAPPDMLPVCLDPSCPGPHPDGCVAVVDGDELAEVVRFVRELGPMLESLRTLTPVLLELRPLAAQLGAAAARGGPAAILGLLMGRSPAAEL